MRVQHNISAINANRNLTGNNSAVSKSLEKLSSGYRINRAGDDAAGLAISEKMRAQISCLTQAETNCNDGVSLIQTAEGALTEVHSMLNRMVELAEQSANGTYDNETDRANLQSEVQQLKDEIDRISQATNFNGINLLDGSLGKTTGSPATMPKIGDELVASKAVVTKVAGASLQANESVAVSNNVADADAILVETTNSDTGEAKAVSINLKDAITITNGDNSGKTLSNIASTKQVTQTTTGGNTTTVTVDVMGTNTIKKGETARIDLSAAGLGIIEFTAEDDTTVAELVTGLGAKVAGAYTAPTGDDGSGLTLQIGDTADSFNKLTVSVQSMSSSALGLSGVDISTQDGAANAVKVIKNAINTVSSTRGDLGAMQNRLEHTINNLSVTNENITNAESRIRDTDMAKEMMTYTSKNILAQAAQSMLAQANQQPQQVLSLLQ